MRSVKTTERNVAEDRFVSQHLAGPSLKPSSHLHMITAHDLQDLRNAIAGGKLPPDLETKLTQLSLGDLGRRFIGQNCLTMIALLLAAQEGSFKAACQGECERLLQVLAYVRKDDDGIPDYRPDGFTDDQREVRAITTEFGPLIQEFKGWRLCHQVPRMWS